MKKFFNSVYTALLIMIVVLTGCSKKGSNDARVPLPDVSDFTIVSASPFAAGTASTVKVTCSTLGSATYKVYFDLTGSNTITSQSATLVLSGGAGSFKTPVLPVAGPTFLTINSITNTTGAGTAFQERNKYTISDSTGLMYALIDNSINFRATNVLATMSGTRLTLRAVIHEPYESSLTMYINNYTHTIGVIDFSSYNVPEVAQFQYQIPGGGVLSANGTINITHVVPSLEGTFIFTGMDSTHFTHGTFSVPPPTF